MITVLLIQIFIYSNVIHSKLCAFKIIIHAKTLSSLSAIHAKHY